MAPQPPTPGPLTVPSTPARQQIELDRGAHDQVFPPNIDALTLLTDGDCTNLLSAAASWEAGDPTESLAVPVSLKRLYEAAAYVCKENWPAAALAKSDVVATQLCVTNTYASLEDCRKSRGKLLEWVDEALELHAADPAFRPNIVQKTGG